MTGAITTNSTFDGVDIATRDGVLTSTTATAAAALPKAGGTMTGNISMATNEIDWGDDGRARFGASQDLQIYHDSNRSWIQDVGTSSLIIDTDGPEVDINSGGNAKFMGRFIKDGAVQLYHNGTKKFETTSVGATIGVISDNAERSLTIQSSADSYLRLKTQNDNEVGAIMFGNATGVADGRIQYDSRRMRFFTGNAERLNLTADGRGLSQFTAKAWCNGNFNDGSPDIQDSFNVSSVEYMGSTGYFAVHWDVDTANGDYASFINCYSETATQTGYVDAGFAQNSSYLRFQFYRNGSLYNPAEGHLIIFGY
jgi:hypothetical protein